MASVFIEERAFNEPDLKVSSIKHKIGQHQIMGAILYVWRHSQQKGKVTVTTDELMGWLSIDRYARPTKLFQALIDADFVRATQKKDEWIISGNVRAVERTHSRIAKSKKAANYRYEKEKSQREACLEHAQHPATKPTQNQFESDTQACSLHAIQITDNRLQTTDNNISLLRNDTDGVNASGGQVGVYPWLDVATSSCEASPIEGASTVLKSDEKRTTQSPATVPVTSERPQRRKGTKKTSTLVSDPMSGEASTSDRTKNAIASYCDAYKAKFGNTPVITGVEAGTAKRLVKELGEEKFVKFVLSYLQMNDSWFIKRGYTLQVLSQNLNKVKTFQETGVQITHSMAVNAERDSHNDAVFARVLARMDAEDARHGT